MLRRLDAVFSAWWNDREKYDGFGRLERLAYQLLRQKRKGTPETLASMVNVSEDEIRAGLRMLAGTGVVREDERARYSINMQLFEVWVGTRSETL